MLYIDLFKFSGFVYKKRNFNCTLSVLGHRRKQIPTYYTTCNGHNPISFLNRHGPAVGNGINASPPFEAQK